MIAVKPLFHRNYSGEAGRSMMGRRKVGDGTETTVEQALIRGLVTRMTVVSSLGCLALDNERRSCRLMTGHEGSLPRSVPNLAHWHFAVAS